VSGPGEGAIVVTGEALIDLVLAADGSLTSHPGGGPYNVARTIGRLGQPVAYLGRISGDRFGRRLRDQLEADGVSTGSVVETDAPTTLALAELDGAGTASYRFYDAGTSAPGLTIAEAIAALPQHFEALYLGTLGLVFEPMATTLEAIVTHIGPEPLVALDPNCRPATITSSGSYRSRLGRLLARTDVLKVSADDLAWLDPGADLVAAARSLLGGDQAVALVTVGSAGVLVVTRDALAEVPAPVVEVVDTIGAGDAFMGSFLARWREQGHGREALRDLDAVGDAAAFACEVAALTCTRAGADPPDLAAVTSRP
jgi:fructokinase